MAQLPIPVQVASWPPGYLDSIERLQGKTPVIANVMVSDVRRFTVDSPKLDWERFGFEPRWIGFDTSDCAVSIQPALDVGQDVGEFERFRRGATARGEIALVLSTIGHREKIPWSLFGPGGDYLIVGKRGTAVAAQPVGAGSRVRAADNLGAADNQLALLLQTLSPAPKWHFLSLVRQSQDGRRNSFSQEPEGHLIPILETELGEPVVAAWASPGGGERRYIVPSETPWPVILKWLTDKALPEFVPGALSRARRFLSTDDRFMTRREREAQVALSTLEEEYTCRRQVLANELESAENAATAIREELLYGTGTVLVGAVKQVFETAGITVVDLDEELGGTKNADLLCAYGDLVRLVEVKSATGRASEQTYSDLHRHLREWPNLEQSRPISGGALVISHEIRKAPHERKPKPFERPEFLASVTEPIASALDLFFAWRDEDWEEIRRLLFGAEACSIPHAVASDDMHAPGSGPHANRARRGWSLWRWFFRS